MEQSNQAVEIHHLSKTIKKKQLLEPLSYQLSKGKILTLCGGNGAGKSTLIRTIIGQIKPTTGKVILNGRTRKQHKSEFLQQFSYMPDDFQFQKTFTTKETMEFYAKINKISKTEYLETIKEVGLFDKLHEKVGNFSKGMNQRLLLAQALMAHSEILILDEPTNGLDPYWVKQFSDLMVRAKNKGQTIIFSTHDLHVAEQIADEVMFLRDGKVISKGSMEQYRGTGLYETFNQLYLQTLSR